MTLTADIGYGIKDVKYPQMRGRLIMELFDLMDIEHQEKEWFGKGPGWFGAEFFFVVETFDDLHIFDVIAKKIDIQEYMGSYCKSKKEIDAAINVAIIIKAMLNEFGCYSDEATNEQYRNSKYLTLLREAAKEAYDIFMGNEKDNAEFMDFISKAKVLRQKELQEK